MVLWRTVEGALLSQIERKWLVDTADSIAERFESPLFLNVGISHGASMHCMRAGAPGASLVGIDVSGRRVQELDILRAQIIRRDSRQMGGWDRPVHLLFVDGGHVYEVVRSDIRVFGRHVVAGGIVAFHDYDRSRAYLEERARRHPRRLPLGVRRAVDELVTESRGWEVLRTIDSIKAFRREG